MGLHSITARGHMVCIKSSENGSQLISRKEALHRAQAIIGLDQASQDLVDALLTAADQARKNEFGKGYESSDLAAIRNAAKLQAVH